MNSESEQVLVLTKWAQKWLKFGWNIVLNGTPTEQLAKRIVKELDSVLNGPTFYVDDIVEERTRTVAVKVDVSKTAKSEIEVDDYVVVTDLKSKEEENVVKQVISRKVTQKIRRQQRSNFSAAVAKEAYNKFGERPMSPANVLVTRKWIQKYLEDQFKDLRTCDKNVAIDRAMFLSFVPTKDFLTMRVVMETKEMNKRMEGSSWFGKVFRLVSEPSQSIIPQ